MKYFSTDATHTRNAGSLLKAAPVPRRALGALCLAIACVMALPLASARGYTDGSDLTPPARVAPDDSVKKAMIISARSTVPEKINVSIRSVDISRFPNASVILDARDSSGVHYPSLKKTDLILYQDGRPVAITSLENISTQNSIPVDIVFVIDQTGSMRQEVNEVKTNIAEFTQRLSSRGIDYRLGLITFSDRVERRIELDEDVNKFISWIDGVTIGGGGDDNENALEGLAEGATLKFRKSAQKIFILITDAMYHQKGDHGDGKTDYTTQSMVDFLLRKNIRLFTIVPESITAYATLTDGSRGKRFNIVENFSSILDEFSRSITNLYAAHYRITAEVPPESIELEIRNYQNEVVVNEHVPVLEVDRKFILENILFDFNQATFDQTYVSELRNILLMLKSYPSIHIEIRGHTDFIGSDEYNIALSDARARAVKQFLVSRGIQAIRITTRGMGKSQPIASNDSELGRRLNRRTEIIITEK
jgi:outer membrane protein OmpA-like peptidoglycan-associated protein/Mg-chelatase subunit ChlD